MYIFRRIKFIISQKYGEFCYRCQRFNHGYAYWDLICFQEWFLNNVVTMLNDIRKNEYSYPCQFKSIEEWEKVLNDMIFYFTESNEETCSVKNEYEYIFDEKNPLWNDKLLNKKWSDRSYEIEKYQKDNFKNGMKLFTKYFWNIGI